MTREPARMARERQTIKIMIRMYCKDKHGTEVGLCEKCGELQDYAMKRLDKCKFQADKPTCANCPVHCYKPSMRETVKDVMRYSGPRMLLRHPIRAIRHLIDGRKKIDRD
jgi:hypothetical protein